MTTLSSSTMKSSAEYSTSPASLASSVRRGSFFGSPWAFCTSAISPRTTSQRSCSLPSRLAICFARRRLSASSLRDDQDLEARQPVDLQLQDRVGLLGVQLEALDDLLGRVRLAVRLADDAQDLVEGVEDALEALEDVDAPAERGQLVLEPRGHHVEAEVQEVPEDLVQVEPLGPADLRVLGRDQAGEVDGDVGLERRVLEEVRHHQVRVGVLLQLERDPDVVGREVAYVHQLRQLARERRPRRCARRASPC